MLRLIESNILDWKKSTRRKPLILRGGRQVGKTWLIENFLAGHFEHFIKIDLEERLDLHVHFEGNLDPKVILESLELSVGRITPGKTLLFFDEIQSCPRAIMALRYFYEKLPELHVIAAGSLLEFAFDQIPIPVGRVQYLHMYPMTFYEYLLATDKEPMAKMTQQNPADVSDAIQMMILEELKTYMFVGGMPESVKTYAKTSSLLESFAVQSEILQSYQDDFSKYRPQIDTSCLEAVFTQAALNVGQQIKYTKLNKAHTGPTNRKAFELLCKARIIQKISSCSPAGIPLGATINQSKFKACFLDIGLLQSVCKVPVDSAILEKDLLAIYQGKLAEQFVAQEILAQQQQDLHYWSRDAKSSNAEVDFLTTNQNQIMPIEVKSGRGGSLKSLHLMLKEFPNCPKGYVLYSSIYKELPEQKLSFYPLYYAASLVK
jgi:uncharacterized protein